MKLLTKITAQAIASSVAMTSLAKDHTPAVMQVCEDFVATAGETPIALKLVEFTASPYALTGLLEQREWTSKLEKRFLKLAKLSALGSITKEDQRELTLLQTQRRNLRCPRKDAEIIWAHEQRQVTQKLIAALQAYVQFHDTARYQKGKAKG